MSIRPLAPTEWLRQKDLLNDLKKLSKETYVSPADIAVIYIGLREKDQAFEWLEKAYEERSGWAGLSQD